MMRSDSSIARHQVHAHRFVTCACGREVYGNGRMTHQRTCEPYLERYGYPLAEGTVDGIRADLRDQRFAIDVPGGHGRRPVYASDVLPGIQARIGQAVLARRRAGNRQPLGHRELLDLLGPAAVEATEELLAAHNGARR